MKIREKEVGFLYTVGAVSRYQDWCVANSKSSVFTAQLVEAEFMSRAYAEINGTKEFITKDELDKLMPYELEDVLKAVKTAKDEGSKRRVTSSEAPKKTDDQ